MKKVEIKIAGKSIQAKAGETVIHALWNIGMAEAIKTGCFFNISLKYPRSS